MKEVSLKPCPFCGGEAKVSSFDWGYSVKEYWVYCSCGCELEKFHSKEEAIQNWNTRKPMDNIVAELEALKNLHSELSKDGIDFEFHNGCEAMCEDAIDIVKAGGVE